MTTPTTGHYVITHPYGVDAFDVTDTATRNINFTEDIGIGAPGDFKGALGSRVEPVPALGHRPDQGPGRRVVPR